MEIVRGVVRACTIARSAVHFCTIRFVPLHGKILFKSIIQNPIRIVIVALINYNFHTETDGIKFKYLTRARRNGGC